MSTSSADYTLSYFNGRGLGELSRLLFAASGTPFVDDRVAQEAWPTLKASTPFGKMPFLTLKDGSVIAQSKAIERFLAKKFHLLGKDDTEAALIEMVIEQLVDFRKGYWDAKSKKDEGVALKEFLSKDFAPQLALFEAFLNKRKDQSTPFFIGNKFSLADLSVYYLLWQLETTGTDDEKAAIASVLKSSPHLSALKQAVAAMPSIKEYEAKRPVTPW